MILILFQLTMNSSTSSSISRNFGAQTRLKDDYRFTNTTISREAQKYFQSQFCPRSHDVIRCE